MSNALQISIMLSAAVLQLGLTAWIALYIYRAKDTSTRRAQLYRVAWVAAALWFIAGSLWSQWGVYIKPVGIAFLPQILTTWPAHEAALVLSGHGLGANFRTPIVITSLCALVWALILWSPLLAVRSRRASLSAAATIELSVLTLTGALFFPYGNG